MAPGGYSQSCSANSLVLIFVRHSNKERDNVAELRPGSNTGLLIHRFPMTSQHPGFLSRRHYLGGTNHSKQPAQW